MIYIQTINRYWDAGAKLLQGKDKKTVQDFQEFLAREYVRLIKLSIDEQRYRAKWKDLTPGYLEYKRRHGLSLNIWEATGQLKDSIKISVIKGKNIVIGFDKRKNHVGSRTKLWKIAQYMEYGTLRMPPRPLFRIVYMYMSSNMSYFWDKYQREKEEFD